MNEEPTLSLEELGEVKTVRVYNQAYVDKQQKRIEELESQIEKMKCCMKCEHWHYYKSFCDKDNSHRSEGQCCEHFILRR